MQKLLHRLLFKKSLSKRSVLLQNPPYSHELQKDVPEEVFATQVSPYLGVDYLSQTKGSADEIKSKREYKGAIIGKCHRLLVSIPTSHSQLNRVLNVHYLIDTSSKYTYLTRRSLCALNQIPSTAQLQFKKQLYLIGGKLIQINWGKVIDPNVNILGLDFLKKFKQYTIELNNRAGTVDLKLK